MLSAAVHLSCDGRSWRRRKNKNKGGKDMERREGEEARTKKMAQDRIEEVRENRFIPFFCKSSLTGTLVQPYHITQHMTTMGQTTRPSPSITCVLTHSSLRLSASHISSLHLFFFFLSTLLYPSCFLLAHVDPAVPLEAV